MKNCSLANFRLTFRKIKDRLTKHDWTSNYYYYFKKLKVKSRAVQESESQTRNMTKKRLESQALLPVFADLLNLEVTKLFLHQREDLVEPNPAVSCRGKPFAKEREHLCKKTISGGTILIQGMLLRATLSQTFDLKYGIHTKKRQELEKFEFEAWSQVTRFSDIGKHQFRREVITGSTHPRQVTTQGSSVTEKETLMQDSCDAGFDFGGAFINFDTHRFPNCTGLMRK